MSHFMTPWCGCRASYRWHLAAFAVFVSLLLQGCSSVGGSSLFAGGDKFCNTTRTEETNGRVSHLTYDAACNLVTYESAGNVAQLLYLPGTQKVTELNVTEKDGTTSWFRYQYDPSGQKVVEVAASTGKKFSIEYTEDNKVSFLQNEKGQQLDFDYGTGANPKTLTLRLRGQGVVKIVYDDDDNIVDLEELEGKRGIRWEIVNIFSEFISLSHTPGRLLSQ